MNILEDKDTLMGASGITLAINIGVRILQKSMDMQPTVPTFWFWMLNLLFVGIIVYCVKSK